MQDEYDEYKRRVLGVWNIVDKEGNVVDTKHNDELPKAYRAGRPVRKNVDTGQWEAYPEKPRILLNKETGDITVNAPRNVVNKESFRAQLDPVLTQLSANYKMDPEYKYALTTDETQAKTTEEWLADLEKDLPALVSQVESFERARDEVWSKAGVKLSDEDIITMGQVALERKETIDGKESVVKIKDTDRQAIPLKIAKMPAFKGRLEGYDEETQTVEWKNLKKAWDRKEFWDSDALKDEDLLDVYHTVRDYFEKGDFSDPKEYAAMVAFEQFIENKDPDAGFFKSTGTLLASVGHGILTGAADFDVKLGQFGDWAYDHLTLTGVASNMWADFLEKTGAVTPEQRALYEKTRFRPSLGPIGSAFNAAVGTGAVPGIDAKYAPNFTTDFFAEELSNYADSTMQKYADLADGYATGYVLAKEITPIAMQAVIGNAVGSAIKAGVISDAGVLVNQNVKEAAALASVTSGVEKLMSSAVAGTELSMTLASTANLVSTVSSSINVLKSAKALGTVADIGAQIIVDTVLTDPKSFERFMSSDASIEDKQYIAEQIGGNIVGWGVGVGVSKSVAAIGKTKIGKIANETISRRIYGVRARVGNYTDALKTALHAGDSDWLMKKAHAAVEAAEADPQSLAKSKRAQRLQRKRNVLVRNRAERAAYAKIGSTDSMWKDLSRREGGLIDELYDRALKQEATKVNMLERARWVTAATSYHHAVEQTIAELKSYSVGWSSAERAMIESYGNVLKLGGSVMHGNTAAMSQEVSNFINAKQFISRAKGLLATENMAELEQIGFTTQKLNAVRKELADAEALVAGFADAKPKELVDACEDFYDKLITATTEQNDAFMNSAFPVLNSDEMERLRDMRRFSSGYFHQERIHDYEEWLTGAKRGALLEARPMFKDHKSMTWSGDDNWADPFLAYMIDQQELSRRYVRTRAVEGLEGLGFTHEVLATGEDSLISDRVTDATRSAVERVRKEHLSRNNLTTAVKDVDLKNNVHNAIIKDVSYDTNISRAQKVEARAHAKFTRTAERGPVAPTAEGVRDHISAAAEAAGGYENLAKGIGINTRFGRFQGNLEESVSAFPTDKRNEIIKVLGDDYDKMAASAPEGKKLKSRESMTTLTDKNVRRYYRQHKDMREDFWRTYLLNNTDDVWYKSGLYQEAALDKYAEDLINDMIDHGKKHKALEELRQARDEAGLGKVLSEGGEPMGLSMPALEDVDEIIDTVIRTSSDDLLHRAIKDMNPDGIDLDTVDLLSRFHMIDGVDEKQLAEAIKSEFDASVDAIAKKKGKKNVSLSAYEAFKKKGHEYIDQAVHERLAFNKNKIMGQLHERGMDEFIGEKGFFAKVDEANRSITKAKRTSAAEGMVWTYADNGKVQYVKMSPTVATMFAEQPITIKHGRFWHLQRSLCNIFRMGTTGGLIPASLARQWSRDTGSALVHGDAWMTNKNTQAILSEVFGDDLAENIRLTSPDTWSFLLKETFGEEEGARLVEKGVDMEGINKASAEGAEQLRKAAVERETALGQSQFKYERESELYNAYQDTRIDLLGGRSATGHKVSLTESASRKLNDFTQKQEYLNNIREDYLRKRVYQNNFTKALEAGHSVETARNLARYVSAEATTNFSRQTYYLNQLSETVPYLRSAINGSKSFWSLMTLDPVGMTTRIVGGYVIPTIALTNLVFSNEEDARIYKQIPEYEKQDNLVFVLQGTIFKLPIPQEISSFVMPIQHMVEKIHGMNDKSTLQLMANDLVGFSPLDLSGFVNIEADSLIEQDIVHRNLIPGISRLASQMLPPLAKAGIMRVTGVDPYTMKRIDTSWVTIDPETGEAVPMDYNSGELAKGIAKLFSGIDSSVSPGMAQAIMESLIGDGTTDILNRLTGIGYGVISKDKEMAINNAVGIGEDFLSKGDASILGGIASRQTYERANVAWNRAVRTLEEEKNAILNSKEYQALSSRLNDPSLSETARDKIKSQLASKREEFQNKVLTMTERLSSDYDGTFDRNKYAAVLNLMIFAPRTPNQDQTNAYESDINSQQYYLNRAKAVETMAKMGFRGTEDYSIFGYYHTAKDGSVEIKYNTPTQILAFDYTQQEQNKILLSNVTDLVNENSLWDAHDEVRNQISAIYDSEGKPDYDAIAAIQINWNAQVAAALAPLVERYSAQAVFGNKGVRDYLYSLIEVPGDWEVNDYGKHMSRSKLGSRGDKKGAYYNSWFRRMFNITDKYKGPAQ